MKKGIWRRHALTANDRRIFALLLRWRLRYFTVETYRLLQRRWQTVLFTLLLASPAMMSLLEQFHLLAIPVLRILQPGQFQTSLLNLMVVLTIACCWSAIHATALRGGPGWRYISRPLPPILIQRVNLALLALSDLPLLLPFFAGILILLHQNGIHALPEITALTALAMQLPIIQLLARNNFPFVVICLLLDLPGLWTGSTGQSTWLLASSITLSNIIGLRFSNGSNRTAKASSRLLPVCLQISAEYGRTRNLAAINLRYVLGSQNLGWYFGLLFFISLPILLQMLLSKHELHTAILIAILSVASIPLVLRIATLSFALQHLHAPMAKLYHLYGVKLSWRRFIDILVLGALFLLADLPATVALSIYHLSWFTLALPLIGLSVLTIFIRIHFWKMDREHILQNRTP